MHERKLKAMHVVISCIGTYGDLCPYLAIGRTLAARGHEVHVLSSENFRLHVERAGLRFSSVASAEQYLAAVRDPNSWNGWTGLRTTWRRLWQIMPQGYRELVTHIRPGQTVLIGSSLALWVRIAQEKFALPAATVHLSPMPLLSADSSAATLAGFARLPPWAVRLGLRLANRLILDPLVLPDVNRFRASIDLPPIDVPAVRWLHSPQRVICAFPSWFAAPAADWPRNSVCTDFPRLPPAEDEVLGAALLGFIEGGAPPIAFTPGSGMAHGGAFFERALAACRRLGRRAVLITPFRAQLPAQLPDFAFHTPYVHYALLAPRVAVFVHHGGIGTLAQLMASGTPQLITPFAVDQPDNAARAERLGVARRISPQAPLREWLKALRALLDEGPPSACASHARAIAAARPGSELIADWIETLRPQVPLVA